MKKHIVLLLIVGTAFIIVGVGGYVFTRVNDVDSYYGYGMMNQGWRENEEYKDGDYYGRGSKMPGRLSGNLVGSSGELYELDELTHEVQAYIERYDTDLAIGDIFIFEDTEYYYSIIEEDTGKGAMELLVNPYTKDVYPEYGPNMMWNLKYGMHNAGGMIGHRSMMGYYDDAEYFDYDDYSEDNEITSNEAYNAGIAYLASRSIGLTLGDEYHDFYGYYTFHVVENGESVGMLSINGFTGAIWYHDWHGELVEIIGVHEEDEH